MEKQRKITKFVFSIFLLIKKQPKFIVESAGPTSRIFTGQLVLLTFHLLYISRLVLPLNWDQPIHHVRDAV